MAWAAISVDEDNGMPSLAIGCAKAENSLCEQIPGCNFSKKDGIWRLPLSWPGYVAFRTIWASQPVTQTAHLLDWAASAWADVQIAYGLRRQMDGGDRLLAELADIEHTQQNDAAGGPGCYLFPFQRGGVDWLVTQQRVVLNDPQGNGKTPQCIRAVQVLQGRGLGSGCPALVVCAGAMIYGWRDEFAKWAPELSVRVVSGTALRRRQALEDEPADVYIISWPNLRMHTRLAAYPGQRLVKCDEHGGVGGKTAAQCEVHLKELNAISWRVFIADEAHRMKDAKSKQTRAAWQLAFSTPCFWPVTGTLIGDSIEDLWPVTHALDPRGFPAKSRFLDLYAVREHAWHGGTEILDLRPDTKASFHASVQPLVRRIPKELARPQMPPRMPPVFRYPEMSPKQLAAYRQMKKTLLADLDDGSTIVSASSLTAFTRLCQLAASSVETRDGEDAQGFTRQLVDLALPSSKADDLLDYLSDNPGQLVVAANSPRLVELAEQKLASAKITHCKIIGEQNDIEKYRAQEWFQAGDCRVIFITKAGSESITLTAASAIFFLQPQPSYLAREQAIGRVDRIGQQFPVQVIHSITPGTVEKGLYLLGNAKEERAGSVTSDKDLLRWIAEGGEDREPAGTLF